MRKPFLALAFAAFCVAAHAEQVGRLFFTSEQRQLFDLQSRAGMRASTPAVIKLNGAIRRRNAAPTFWINGQPFTQDPALGRITELRIGEAIDTRTRQTRGLLPDAAIITPTRR